VDVGAYEFPFDAIQVVATGITNWFGGWPSRFEWSTTGGVSNNPALKTFTLTNLAWSPGSSLFLVWADDNGSGNPDAAFSIDKISFIPTPPPRLTVNLMGTQIELAWRQSAADFILEATPDLGSTTTWTKVATSAESDSGFFHLRLPAQQANQFFRLRRP
jgi:hypothetical protein